MNKDQRPRVESPSANQAAASKAIPQKRRRWKQSTSLSMLLVTIIGSLVLTLHFLAPIAPGRAESFPARVGRYVSQGQWRADFRTFGAAWSYCLQRESEPQIEANTVNPPIAVTSRETLPRS